MTTIQAIILGIVEGITEFLPISSTGHLILTNKLLDIAEADFIKSFEIAIQFGAILAVVVLYWKKLFSKGSPSSLGYSGSAIWKKVLVAFLPTAMLGFLFYKILKEFLLESTVIVLWYLLLSGVFLILFELLYQKSVSPSSHGRDDYGIGKVSCKKSFGVGVVQALAIIPGVSRVGSTIVGGDDGH